jgi:hypothetical protein
MTKLICDRCKKESEPMESKNSTLSGWKQLNASISYSTNKRFDICPECVDLLGLAEGPKDSPSLGDQLLDLISDIATEATERGVA